MPLTTGIILVCWSYPDRGLISEDVFNLLTITDTCTPGPYLKLCRFAVTRPTHENRTDSKNFLVRFCSEFFFIRFETLSYLEGNTKSNFGEYKRGKFVKLVQKRSFMTICINKIEFLSVQVHKRCRLLALVYSDQKRSHQNGSRVLIFKKKLCKDIFHLEMCQKNLAVLCQDFLRSDEDRWEWPGGGGVATLAVKGNGKKNHLLSFLLLWKYGVRNVNLIRDFSMF